MDLGLFNLLMIGHLFTSFIYVIFFRKKISRYLIPIVIFVPYISVFIILIVHLSSKIGKQERQFEVEEVFLETDKMEYISQIDGRKEMDIIPVEEALILNDDNVQRSIVMEVAKRDPIGYLTNLKRALLSEDSETAHYAASSITELKRAIDKELSIAEKAYNQNPTSLNRRRAYIEVLDQVLTADLAIYSIKKKNIMIFIKILIEDIGNSEKSPHRSFQLLCDYLIETEKFNEAEKWIHRYQKEYSRSDKPLGLMLKMAYKTKNHNLFEQTMQTLEKSSFPITQKTKRIIDFWGGENSNEK